MTIKFIEIFSITNELGHSAGEDQFIELVIVLTPLGNLYESGCTDSRDMVKSSLSMGSSLMMCFGFLSTM